MTSIATKHSLESQLTMPSSIHSTERNPFLRAQSLAELLAWDDLNFIRCAYVTLLGRQPDPQGEAVYTAMIRSGQHKLKVLAALRFSEEGRNHDPGIAGLDAALRRYRLSTKRGLGWLVRLSGRSPLEDSATQLRRMETVLAGLSQETRVLNEKLGEAREQVAATRAQTDAVISTLALMLETSKSAEHKAASGLAETENLRAILTSFVGEFRSFRDEQVARAADQAARQASQAESVQSILSSFVGEFRAYRDEEAARSRGLLENVRGLKTSIAYEFDTVRREHEMRTNELRDMLETSFEGAYPTAARTSNLKRDEASPELVGLSPKAAMIVRQLRSSRNYSS